MIITYIFIFLLFRLYLLRPKDKAFLALNIFLATVAILDEGPKFEKGAPQTKLGLISQVASMNYHYHLATV